MNAKTLVAAIGAALALTAPVHAGSLFGSSNDEDASKVAKEADTFAQSGADWARPLLRALYRDGEWGAVLNLDRLGLAAMEHREFDLARKAFDEAVARVESIYANDANAEKARSIFNAEKVKDWKGEPYERAMMYYYRGLLYLHAGDFQNGRAAFLAADRHDTLSSAEDTAYAGNFGMMKYLAAWASSCDGDSQRAEQLLQEARAADSKLSTLPARLPPSLVLVESGPAPVKWGDGQYRQLLKFRPGDGDDPPPALRLAPGADSDTFAVLGDVSYQATTRGGREVDGILAGKARFKDGASAVGDGALLVGGQLLSQASASGDRGMANFGLAGMFLGLVAKGVERASTPEADIRAWDTLPARVLVHLPAADLAGPVQLVSAGRAVPLSLQAQHGRCAVAWGRTRSAVPTGEAALPTSGAEADRGSRNRSFRAMLVAELSPSH